MPETALVTGASAGIGTEFARYHAEKGGDLIITARRTEALEKLKTELEAAHGISVTVIAADLSAPGGAENLIAAVDKTGATVDILINNAGFGGHGRFVERALADDLRMIDLNVKALVILCHHFAGQMAQRGRGRILNVSSSASHMPGPLQATYFATKAFVSSFSQAIDHELRGRGVTVTALEPGYVETEFATTANLEGTNLVKKGATARSVAKFGYDAMRRGELRAMNDPMLRFATNWIVPLMPRRAALKMVERMQAK